MTEDSLSSKRAPMKKILLLVMVLFLFLLSCTSKDFDQEFEDEALKVGNAVNETVNNSELEEQNRVNAQIGLCTAAWTCLSSSQKMYRYENCSFGQRQDCRFGCTNGSCRTPPTCTVGFKCHGQHVKGYQLEDCSWISETKCDYGCENAQCRNASSSGAEIQNETAASTPPPPQNFNTISVGETLIIDIGGTEHPVSIYTMESGQAKIIVDGQRSDWLEEGDSFGYVSGVTITVKSILFQSFEGGTREVEFVLE